MVFTALTTITAHIDASDEVAYGFLASCVAAVLDTFTAIGLLMEIVVHESRIPAELALLATDPFSRMRTSRT